LPESDNYIQLIKIMLRCHQGTFVRALKMSSSERSGERNCLPCIVSNLEEKGKICGASAVKRKETLKANDGLRESFPRARLAY
jgi:hypothetical protein